MRMQHSAGGGTTIWRNAVVAAVAVIAAAAPTAGARASGATSQQVAAEIVSVQAQADKTAQQWSDAQRRSDDLQAQIQDAQAQLASASARYGEAQANLTRIAVADYTGGGHLSLMMPLSDVGEQMQSDVLLSIAADAGADDLDTIDAARTDLQNQQRHLNALEAQNARTVAELAKRAADLNGQLAHLATLEQNLKNAEVKQAYDAMVAKQRRDAAAAAAKAAAQAAAQAPPTTQPRGSGALTSPGTAPTPPAPTPPPPSVRAIVGPGFRCPVDGPNAFGDTFGAPRPGGRKHQGVDMMSPYGTPLVAVVDGTAVMKTDPLGGNVVSLTGVDGNRYYYAHLSSWQGPSRPVHAGDVVGYVGHTGDTTANHLHFEIHPGGGPAIDPTPIVRQYC